MKKWCENRWFRLASEEYRLNQKKILRHLAEMHGGRLLDIGCKDGSFTMEIAARIKADELYGMEIDEKEGERAYEKGINVRICDANLPFPFQDSYFDVITANQVIEHLSNTDGFFKEINRVLKPGGSAMISTQNFASTHNLFLLTMGMQPISLHISRIQVGNFLYGTETDGHIKIFTLPALKDLARYHGLEVEETYGSGFYPAPNQASRILASAFKRYSAFIGIKIKKPE